MAINRGSDDINMDPKPQPVGDDAPSEGTAIDAPPQPPEAETIDNPLSPSEPAKKL